MGLGYAIVSGLTGALGSLIPWFTSPSKDPTYSLLLWIGVFVMIAGVGVCSLAGHERDKQRGALPTMGAQGGRFVVGLAICITGGVLSCLMNLGFTYGAPVTQRALELGATPTYAPNALWLVVMGGGIVAIAVYCGYLLVSKGTWKNYGNPGSGRNFGWALLMALIWEVTLVAYGVGANRIGALGTSVGWAALLSVTVVISNIWGAATGEWRGAGRRAVVIMIAGIATLVVAVGILGWAATKV
jgi:L-rhamnose-H+ transport protein